MGKLYRLPYSHSNPWLRMLPLIGIFVITCTIVFAFAADTALAKTLKQGSYGEDVKAVQQALQDQGYYSGNVDGIFGSNTAKAVRSFQENNGINVDGIVGSQTMAALGIDNTSTASTSGDAATSGFSQADIDLLARAIHAEAEGEPYIGKVAVGAVLINRINSRDFPNTLSGVIYQSLALESVSNGRMNSTSGEESKRAARDAAAGWDPTYGCLYFWNPATATSTWIWSRQVSVQYGKHVFGI